MMERIQLCDWQLAGFWPYTPIFGRSVETGVIHGGITPSIPAKVPGTVHADLLRAGLIEDPYYETNSLLCEWVPERWWLYRNTFRIPKEWEGKRIRVTFMGIDYKAHIRFNRMPEVVHEGMYTHVVLDLTDYVKFDEDNSLEVILEAAPDEMSQIGHTSLSHTQKARNNYKWDFCTRLIHLGLYDEVYLEAVGNATISDSHVRYQNGAVTYRATVVGEGNLHARLSYHGDCVGEAYGTETLTIPVAEPKLWYPNGYGAQPLYDLSVTLFDKSGYPSDEKHFRIGLRTLSYQQCEDAIPSSLPYQPVVNGQKIYIKGVNCTPFDLMYGTVEKDRYDQFLSLAKDAGVNLIRVWGGGMIEKETFYDLCDEYGIMVWQEFIQSSSGIDNVPSEIPEFLELLAKTSESAVKEKRNHVSLTYWTGGNELFAVKFETGKVLPADYTNPNIAMLKEIVNRLDPDRLMLPTSASGPKDTVYFDCPELLHDIHGPWKYAGVEGQYDTFNRLTSQLHAEFGNDGVGNYETLCSILAPRNRIVTTPGENYTWRHHGEWWDTYSYRDRPIFGEIRELQDFCILSQYMQAEGLRYALEANRRRVWHNCGSIVWQFNEPWPNVSCTNMVDYYARPKLAYYFYRDAMKTYHVSLRYDKLIWRAGETLSGIPFVHDDTKERAKSEESVVSIRIYDDSGELLSTYDGAFAYNVPECTRTLRVVCRAFDPKTGREDTSEYLFFVVTDENPHADQKAVLDFVKYYRKTYQ